MVRRAFTLIEILVVVAIIATLIAILVPAISGTYAAALRARCATNLKGQGQSLAVYAAAFADKIPVFNPGDTTSRHLNEETVSFSGAMLNASGTPSAAGVRWFFCPANPTGVPATLGTLLDYAYLNIRVATNDLTSAGPGSPLPSIPPTLRVGPSLSYHDRWTGTANAATSEMAMDLIVNNNATSDFSATVPNVGSTNHMRSDTYPDGANVLCFDGHVSYQKFAGPVAPAPGVEDVVLRRAALKMNDGAIFYFPAP